MNACVETVQVMHVDSLPVIIANCQSWRRAKQ